MNPQPAQNTRPPALDKPCGTQGFMATVAVSLVMVLAVAVIDYYTGLEVSVTLLYLIPVCWCTWHAGRGAGIWIAATCAVAWLGHDLLLGGLFDHPWVLCWNTLTLGGILAVVATLLATLMHTQETLESTVERRTAKLHEEVLERRKAEDQLRHAHAELQRSHAQLIEAAKMETVGRMAAGVAHEVKNPLMTLGMATDYFLLRVPANEDEATLLQDMKVAVQRATDTINLMLDFAKPRPLHLASEKLNALIEHALGLMRHQFAQQQIEVRRQLQDGLPEIQLDRTRMEHVLINLFTNATQAMPAGGTLTVRSSLHQAGGTGQHTGSQVLLEIEDSGSGVDPDHLPKVFEPFFTTKPPGQGTGLGLTIVRRILHKHGASIALGNRPEGGACATLTFNLKP
jgi:signal transduction histidine kinase